MEEIKGVCLYCMGCNKLEMKYFTGVYRCKNFMPNQVNWEQYYREELKKK